MRFNPTCLGPSSSSSSSSWSFATCTVTGGSAPTAVNPSLFSSNSCVNTRRPHNKIRSRTAKLLLSRFNSHLYCSSSSVEPTLPEDKVEYEDADEDSSQSIFDGDVQIVINKIGNNTRRIRSIVSIDAPLDTVWNILTDYERLANFIPGLAVSQLLDKQPNYARLFQIGQQNLPFGLKFNAKGIVDCYEEELEILPCGQKRDVRFKMIEGDFQIFEGKWSIEELIKEDGDSLMDREIRTSLTYLVDVKPKPWLPVRLVEDRLCKEIKVNLACIREEAHKQTLNTI